MKNENIKKAYDSYAPDSEAKARMLENAKVRAAAAPVMSVPFVKALRPRYVAAFASAAAALAIVVAGFWLLPDRGDTGVLESTPATTSATTEPIATEPTRAIAAEVPTAITTEPETLNEMTPSVPAAVATTAATTELQTTAPTTSPTTAATTELQTTAPTTSPTTAATTRPTSAPSTTVTARPTSAPRTT
ncbi:MAG: hypothetical protein FWD35_00390, partial [Oscillospiraceae bacterium]|nr:hypothetical protein [Oscillospiraceae bacterium]